MNVAGTPVYLGLLLSLSFSVAKAAPSSFTYQGRIVRSDGQALEYNNVSFQFEVTNPSGSCVIYREQVDGIDMTNSKGMFDVAIGGGTRSYPTSGTVELLDVFKNQTSYPCSGGATYNALAADGRLLRVKFHDGTGWKTLSTDNVIRSVPFAGYSASAQKLEDKTLDQFVMKDILPSCLAGSYLTWDATAQAFGCSSLASASVSSFSGALAGDVSGTQGATSVNRLKGAVIDTTGIAANKILKFDGTKWVMGDDNTGGAPADASYSVKGIVQFTTDAATSGINIAAGVASVNVGTAANQIVKLDNLAKLPAVDGSALGNINAVKIQGKDVTLTAPSVNQVLQYDGSKFVNATLSFTDNDTLAALPCANGYVSYKAAGAWTCLAVSSTNVANTLMSRDSGGNFSATSADVNSLVLRDGVTAGTVSLSVPAGFTAYSLVWPSIGGTSGQVLGKGVGNNLQWMSAQTNTLTTGKIWVGSSNVANEVSMSGQATMDSSGVVTLANAAGDVSGAYSALSVDKIKGKAVDTTGIAVNKILKYDGTKWVMGDDNTGDAPADASYSTKGIVQFTTDAATSGINIAAGVASVNAGTNPNQLVKLDGSSKLPAVDGSQLTNISVSNFSGALAGDVTGTQAATSVVKIQNRAVSNTAPDSGDVLKWDGSAWSPGADAAGWTAVDATTTTKGIMRVGSQLAVSSGLVSVDSTTTGVASKVLSLDGSSVATASGMAVKGAFGTSTIQASNSVFTNYSLTLPTSTGSNGQVLTSTGVSGVLNWTTPSTGWTAVDATTSSKGIVQIGSGINVASGTISVPAATTSTQGIMQVGAGLAVTTGTVKADSTTTAQANKLLMLDGSGVALAKGFSTSGTTSGSVTLQSATGTYSLTLPTALPGTSGQVLSSTTGGVMSWVTAMTNALTTDRIWIGNAGVATPTVVTGDVALSGGSFTVDGIQGRSVASTAPSTNDVLKWNGSTWTPGAATASSTPTIAAKSADFTVGTSEENYLYLVSGTTTATLPSVGSVAAGFRITLKRIGGGNVNVVANGTETIDGATTRALSTVYQMISVVNTGTQWVITSGGAVGTPASACVPGSQIFSAGTTYSYSVPADRATNCVFTVTIKGGAGGASNNGYAGGAGGGLQFTFTAPSSGSFEVLVGSNGGTPVAGYGGGGSGSLGTLYIGGGGGGASAIRYIDSGAVDTLLAVVGGGGGGGDSGSPGGAGGSMASGSNGSTAGLNEYGRGASGAAGGAGGTSNAGNGGAGGTSGIGTAGTGANFGAAGTAASIFSISSGGGGGGTATSGHQGGGGGGGYMGGGGGAAGTVYTGGGGGGSSYVNSSKMNSFTSIAGPSTGSPGSVIIEWN